MGILTTDLPPRRERIALWVNRVLAYGGTLLAVLAFYSSFLWVILPTPAYRAALRDEIATYKALHEGWDRMEAGVISNEEITRLRQEYQTARMQVGAPFARYSRLWRGVLEWSALMLLVLPVAGAAIWHGAVARRNRLLASLAVREELAASLLTPGEVLGGRLLAANRAGLRPFLLAAPVVGLLIVLAPLLRQLPAQAAPLFEYVRSAYPGAQQGTVAAERLIIYVGGLVFLMRFLFPFTVMTTFLLRCVRTSSREGEGRAKAILSTRAVIFAGIGAAAVCLSLGLFWFFYDVRLWLRLIERGREPDFLPFVLNWFRLLNLALLAGSVSVLIMLPRWALRRQWREVLENYYRFE